MDEVYNRSPQVVMSLGTSNNSEPTPWRASQATHTCMHLSDKFGAC